MWQTVTSFPSVLRVRHQPAPHKHAPTCPPMSLVRGNPRGPPLTASPTEEKPCTRAEEWPSLWTAVTAVLHLAPAQTDPMCQPRLCEVILRVQDAQGLVRPGRMKPEISGEFRLESLL